jgi:carbohydrate kinase (thermoresistant glucokinase family)
MHQKPTLYVVCGVTACGKSTIGERLAKSFNGPFVEGDDFHPAHNIQKMSSGKPLNDMDRIDWIVAIARHVNSLDEDNIVLSCSALTCFVQDELKTLCNPEIHWIALQLSPDLARKRSQSRNHFMPPSLIESQYEAWSPPRDATIIDASQNIDVIIANINATLKRLQIS